MSHWASGVLCLLARCHKVGSLSSSEGVSLGLGLGLQGPGAVLKGSEALGKHTARAL